MKKRKEHHVQFALLASVVMVSSCVSKKTWTIAKENRELNESYRSVREQLAASQARVTSLEEQLAQQERLCILARVAEQEPQQ